MYSANKKSPRVTLLIPCFKAHTYVTDAIDCALRQTYGHVEIILAPDDGDTYLHLREKYSSPQLRIIPPLVTTGSGAGATRNRAIDASSGEFITMLDADDIIPDNYLEQLMKVAIKDGFAVAPSRYVTWSLEDVRVPPIHSKLLSLTGFSQLVASVHPIIHRSFEIGYCDGFAEDVIHDGAVIANVGTIGIVENVNYYIRLREGSACGSGLDEEVKIQLMYAQRIDQILRYPTQLRLQHLSQHDRNDFAELFKFRAAVSKAYSSSGTSKSYNEWVAGKEATFWDTFTTESLKTNSGHMVMLAA